MKNDQGLALGIVILFAFVFGVAALAALTVGLSRVQSSQEFGNRVQGRYAAEAGLVWAMQKLYDTPTWNSPAGAIDLPLDVNGNGTIDAGEGVDIILAPCGATPCEERTLQAKVVY